MTRKTPKKYINKNGWFLYRNWHGDKAFKISIPFEKLSPDVQEKYKEKIGGNIYFNSYSLFL